MTDELSIVVSNQVFPFKNFAEFIKFNKFI